MICSERHAHLESLKHELRKGNNYFFEKETARFYQELILN